VYGERLNKLRIFIGALLNPNKAILLNIVIITLILVKARIISLYGLYGKS
jgi:hypothetical protein